MKQLLIVLLIGLAGCTALPKLCAQLPTIPVLSQINAFCVAVEPKPLP